MVKKVIKRLVSKIVFFKINLLVRIFLKIFEYKKDKTIIFALPFFTASGGAEKVQFLIAEHLSKSGYKILVLTTAKLPESYLDDSKKFKAIKAKVINVYKFEYLKNTLIRAFAKHAKYIYIAGSRSMYENLPAIKALTPEIKVIDQHYNLVGHIESLKTYKDFIDFTVVENEEVFKYLKAFFKSTSRLSLITNGVDVQNRFNPEKNKNVLRPQSISKNKFIVGFTGRFSEEKGPDLMIKIAEKFKGQKDIEFILAGDGVLFDETKQLTKDLGVEDIIKFPGFVDNVAYYPFFDIFILPSRNDGRPNAVLQSLSMGIPVIASKVGGLPFIIEQGKNGYLCKVEDVEDFARKIKMLKDNPELKKEMSKNSREYALKNLDQNKMLDAYLKIFNNL